MPLEVGLLSNIRNNNIKTLNLSYSLLMADDLKALCKALQNCIDLQRLKLDHVSGIKGAQRKFLIKTISTLPHLKSIDLSYTKIGIEEIKLLVQKLPLLTELEFVDLTGNKLGPEELAIIDQVLLEYPHIQLIYKNTHDVDKKIQDDSAQQEIQNQERLIFFEFVSAPSSSGYDTDSTFPLSESGNDEAKTAGAVDYMLQT